MRPHGPEFRGLMHPSTKPANEKLTSGLCDRGGVSVLRSGRRTTCTGPVRRVDTLTGCRTVGRSDNHTEAFYPPGFSSLYLTENSSHGAGIPVPGSDLQASVRVDNGSLCEEVPKVPLDPSVCRQ
ncbi:hypothetical protein Q5P01_017566 [Channa striata]|uniref:Uncharacterized protein n=1 Tax=Channa striata TaxID=64152 RepID=A0AA88SHH3_CHASR|nr:hypothetical protein Q5P01_017566 [Channa striata]